MTNNVKVSIKVKEYKEVDERVSVKLINSDKAWEYKY